MARSRKPRKIKPRKVTAKASSAAETLTVHAQLADYRQQINRLGELVRGLDDRLEDAEIHINLLTRLLTTLCVEKFGMRIGVLKRIIKRIEKEAIRDSQIMHLESLYKLPMMGKKNPPPQPPAKNDPWEDIS